MDRPPLTPLRACWVRLPMPWKACQIWSWSVMVNGLGIKPPKNLNFGQISGGFHSKKLLKCSYTYAQLLDSFQNASYCVGTPTENRMYNWSCYFAGKIWRKPFLSTNQQCKSTNVHSANRWQYDEQYEVFHAKIFCTCYNLAISYSTLLQ